MAADDCLRSPDTRPNDPPLATLGSTSTAIATATVASVVDPAAHPVPDHPDARDPQLPMLDAQHPTLGYHPLPPNAGLSNDVHRS
jgi:hypothetical protein